MGEEVSPGGSDIFRHEAREREFEVAIGDEALIDAVDEHLSRAFHEYEGAVFHEIVSDLVHVDINLVPVGEGRDWMTLVTCGMAQRPMAVPDGLEDYRYGELMLALPPDWPLDTDAWEDERWYWPVRLLKLLARLPHEYDTFLYPGHTIPNDDPPRPYAKSTKLCGALISPSVLTPEGFERLEVSDGRIVHVYAVVPVHHDEMDFKLEQGTDALWDKLDESGVSELVDPERPSVIGRKRRLFGRG